MFTLEGVHRTFCMHAILCMLHALRCAARVCLSDPGRPCRAEAEPMAAKAAAKAHAPTLTAAPTAATQAGEQQQREGLSPSTVTYDSLKEVRGPVVCWAGGARRGGRLCHQLWPLCA